MKFLNPSMVEMARKSRGLTQSKLATMVGCTQGTLSKIEQGVKDVSDDLIENLSQTLNYPKSFFFQDGRMFAPSIKYRRARSSLSAKLKDQIDSHHNILAHVIHELLQSIEIPENNVPDWPSDDWDSPTLIAQALRQHWKMPRGPIKNFTKLLESNGIIVIETDFKTNKFDGVYYPFPELPPIIFVSRDLSGDRLRFTLAHELGHIIMHQKPKNIDKIEDETDEFASEFCMPARDIRPHLNNLNLNKLLNLKQVWKMSMASILVRANRLATISDRQYKYLWMRMGKAGYKTQEPTHSTIEKESPQIVNKLIKLHLEELDYDLNSISQAVNLSKEEFMNTFNQRPKMKLLTFD